MDDDENPTLTLGSPAGMLAHVLKAYSTHPVDLTYAALIKLGLTLTPPNIIAVHQAIAALLTWMTHANARPGIDTRDTLDIAGHLNLTGHPLDIRETATGAISLLLTWIWGNESCTDTGRRQYIAQTLNHPWDTKASYPTDPFSHTTL